MVATEPWADDNVRIADIAATLCLGTDLGMGFPFEHGLHGTLIAMRLADRLGVDAATAMQTFYASLLLHSGCTTDAEVMSNTFGGSMTTHVRPVMHGTPREQFGGVLRALPSPESAMPMRAIQTVRRLPSATRTHKPHMTALCEVAQILATQLGLPRPVQDLFVHLTERWDGKGPLKRAQGEEISPALRIAQAGRDAAVHHMLGGQEQAAHVMKERAGHAFDPDVAGCLVDGADEILAFDDVTSVWDETLSCESHPHLTLQGEGIDRALSAVGHFADLISPSLAGHSPGAANLAATAAQRCRLDAKAVTITRRAGLVHDVGRVAVHPQVWQKAGRLVADEWEQVRLHPYHTERILSRSPFLSALAPIAGAHHERLDGHGYHRGCSGLELSLPARLLAAADAYQAMSEPRPYREAMTPAQAAEELAREASEGRLDPEAVTAVVEAAGQPIPRLKRPADLTEREAEVIGMLAHGLQTKQIARSLGISVKTADNHIQNAYRKCGVSTRAAATLFAMEHGLIAWRDLAVARSGSKP